MLGAGKSSAGCYNRNLQWAGGKGGAAKWESVHSHWLENLL